MKKPNHMKYFMPAEWEPHEGTWLQWPHDGTNKGIISYPNIIRFLN
ncbi:MAG: agmatine deiminase family protein [Clostridia bacterium]|nr:agmatine deiminase family protein [Clostridia bacterium]